MKIAYVFPESAGGGKTGVLKKLLGQVRAWQGQGHDVRVYFVSPATEPWPGLNGLPAEYFFWQKLRNLYTAHGRMARAVARWRPDVVYCRYGLFAPGLRAVARQFPTIVEINSNDVTERHEQTPRYIYLYNRLTRGMLLAAAKGLVFVAAGNLPTNRHFARFQKPHLVLGNGIDLSEFDTPAPPNNTKPRLVFVGSPKRNWNGVDKMLTAAGHFTEWTFDVVGFDRRQLGATVPENVVAHGHLERAEYEAIVGGADVAIGTLALHRKSISDASPLKVREYLAFGLPTIIGYRDTDFSQGAPFLLQLPNTERNVAEHLSEIEEFVGRMGGVRVARQDIAHLDVAEKEPQRLAFMRQAARGEVQPCRP